MLQVNGAVPSYKDWEQRKLRREGKGPHAPRLSGMSQDALPFRRAEAAGPKQRRGQLEKREA